MSELSQRTAMEDPLLELRGVGKVFVAGVGHRRRRIEAVRGVDLKLHRGESVGLVGESGSGKSTVARIIARLVRPTDGELLLDGRNVLETERARASRQYRHRVQMIFQDPFSSLNPVHTVGHHLLRALRVHGTAQGGSAESTVNALLESVGLGSVPGIAGRFPHELSGGQRQRVAIARALAVRPSVIVADEPTSMLDVSVRVGILNLLNDLRQANGLGVLLITHDLASARYATETTMVMYAGRILESGPTPEIIASPKHPYSELLVSSVPRHDTRPGPLTPNRSRPATGTTTSSDGCPFAPRCPSRMSVCDQQMPPVQYLAPGHWARCHLYGGPAAGIHTQPALAGELVVGLGSVDQTLRARNYFNQA